MTWGCSCPHFKSFPWIYGLAYAAIYVALFLVIGLLGWQALAEWFLALQELENDPNPMPADVFAALFGGFGRLVPLILVASLVGWVVWAMFETASQRRYIFGAKFSLGFGGDEVRIMVVGLLWALMSLVIFVVPIILFVSAFGALAEMDPSGQLDDQTAARFLGTFFAGFGLMFLFSLLYIFIATRLAPCFGLTVKEKEIRFFDAWNVSRGRFWPILGAYVIIVVVVSVFSQIISAIAQMLMMPFLMSLPVGDELPTEEMAAIFLSPAFIAPMALLYFGLMFVQGLTQHFVGAPAALAARHDPRNDLGDAERVDIFS
ncbi:MAG: hypothetical protein B7Z22_03260 [Hyphomonas sp. 32-62-5]|nr:MAG: hypothetical protein B7Z22_03260 [Hyphomonas sp. 32-62-5]